MNGSATRFLRLGVSLAGLVTLGWVITGQAARPVHHGISLPTDWSHRHMVFSHPRSAERVARVTQDPRYWQQMYRRTQHLTLPSAISEVAAGLDGVQRPINPLRTKLKVMSKPLTRDWSKKLGVGGTVGAGNYPAKFSFDTTTAFCDASPTPDYAVFSTGLAGSPTQASVVAYDNLYFGCGGATPLIYWAYNTGGQIQTSPVLSLDGTQVSFVQSVGGFGVLVVMKWAANPAVTIITPTVPTTVLPAAYAACIAPCMTLIPLTDNAASPIADTTSSVYYDYTADVAWVGGAFGWLHKVTGLFKGTPTDVATGGFPVQVNAGNPNALTSPVYDRTTDSVFVGDAGGVLYRVDANNGTVVASDELDFGVGFVEAPVVDSGNGFVYVFASSDGSANCNLGVDCAAVFQLTTSFAAGATGSETSVGDSTFFGTPPNPLHIGSFDSAYYDSLAPSAASGNLYVCGSTGTNPTLYQISIQNGAMPASGLGLAVAPLATTSAACSAVTDAPNDNLPGGFSEHLFVSVQNNGLASGCAGGGCVLNFVSAPWIPFNIYSVGQQVLSSKGHVETVIQAGVSATIFQPTWTTTPAGTNTDGQAGSQVVWIDQGSFSAPFLPWTASFHYVAQKIKILDPNGNVQILTTNPAGGTTGTIQPAWNATPGGITPDNTVIWTNVGAIGTASLPAAGGTSGIIVDNMVGSVTVVGGSQIYFSTLNDQACGTSGTGGCAVQASQQGLN